jgi:predicted DNA binding CopG/RHH family protein
MTTQHEYLRKCLKLKPHEIIKILEDYRCLKNKKIQKTEQSILISIKIPEGLLADFKNTCQSKNVKYQTQIKTLMKEWLSK